MKSVAKPSQGLTLVEMLFSIAITAALVVGLAGIVNTALQSRSLVEKRMELLLDAQFAMERMASMVRTSSKLLLPLADNPGTTWREHVREQSIPAAAPEPGSTFATAVLAITLSYHIDADGDGWSDANDDKDFYDFNGNLLRDAGEPERFDEDLGVDNHEDNAAGIVGIDDNGDGGVDNSWGGKWDNDEDVAEGEDPIDGIDNDNDGSIDEDPPGDMNGDGEAGNPDSCILLICLGNNWQDDDRDGTADEDRLNVVAYYLLGNQLVERLPDFSGVSPSGADYTVSTLAEDVTFFRVERLHSNLVDLTLELQRDGETIRLHNQLRIGSKQ